MSENLLKLFCDIIQPSTVDHTWEQQDDRGEQIHQKEIVYGASDVGQQG